MTDKNHLEIRLWDGRTPDLETKTYMDLTKTVSGKPYDLAIVDGPVNQNDGGPGRSVSIAIAAKIADNIIVHDAGRLDEENCQRAFLRGIFKLVKRSGDHITRCHFWQRRAEPLDIKNTLAVK